MIEEELQTKKIRITREFCVRESDMPKLAQLPIVLKRVVVGHQVVKRSFVKLTPANAVIGAKPLEEPAWADLITGTLYGMDGRSTSSQLYFKGAK